MYILEFLKNNWHIVAIILCVSLFVHIRLNNAENVVKLASESSKEQILIIEKSYKKELEQRDRTLKDYEDKIKLLEDDYKKKISELEFLRKKRVQVIVKYYDNPEKLISTIKKKYGFIYVSSK